MVIEIDCEEDFCSKCEYVFTSRFGTIFLCGLFHKELCFNVNDKLLRCKKCKEEVK